MGELNKLIKRKYKKRYTADVIGFSGDELPEVYTAIAFPSHTERNKKIAILEGAEKLVLDGRPIIVDLFSGCGGFSLGFIQAGWRVVASVENNIDSHMTYAYNLPTMQGADIHCYHKDIRHLSGYEILHNLGLKPGDVDVVIGGPPCQSFSLAGKREVGDMRDNMIFQFNRFVQEIQPKTLRAKPKRYKLNFDLIYGKRRGR